MANPEHVEVVRGGSQSINNWLLANPVGVLHLSDSDLKGANLEHADLSKANLSYAALDGANLSGANLNRAVLDGANLTGADLSGADLRGAGIEGARLDKASLIKANLENANLTDADITYADLSGVVLTGANLTGVDLTGAVLRGGNLRSANLTGTDLQDANLRDVVFTGTHLTYALLRGADFTGAKFLATSIGSRLSQARNLERAKHLSSSSVSSHALLNLPDPFPENFLRGCGLPDDLIDFARAQQGAIQFYSCFISYSHKDEEFARHLYDKLQGKGVRCWYAPEDGKYGDRLDKTIGDAIRMHEKLVLILSEESIESDWVEDEVSRALEKEEATGKDGLIPIMIDNAVMNCRFGWAKRIREVHKPHGRLIGEFTKWKNHDAFQVALDRLLRALGANDQG